MWSWLRATWALVAALVIGSVSGCYLHHDPGGAVSGRDATLARTDGSVPRPDVGPGRRDAGPRRRDAGTGRPDAGPPPAMCVLDVEPSPVDDVCAPSTGTCLTACGTDQACILSCLEADPVCRDCAVLNALDCFNSTPCRSRYPAASCCAVESCFITRPEELLGLCAIALCLDELQPYANCAVATAPEECRQAIARCGLPPTLLGLD